MKGHSKTDREAELYMRYAAEDLAWARRGLDDPETVTRHLVFFAQQACEKSIKAVTLAHGSDVAFGHDLTDLIQDLPDEEVGTLGAALGGDAGETLELLEQANTLSRYPRVRKRRAPTERNYTWDEAERAVALAELVQTWGGERVARIKQARSAQRPRSKAAGNLGKMPKIPNG